MTGDRAESLVTSLASIINNHMAEGDRSQKATYLAVDRIIIVLQAYLDQLLDGHGYHPI